VGDGTRDRGEMELLPELLQFCLSLCAHFPTSFEVAYRGFLNYDIIA
jgi:hypothetical protein